MGDAGPAHQVYMKGGAIGGHMALRALLTKPPDVQLVRWPKSLHWGALGY